MPRNGTGTYLLPPIINPVVTQTLITTSWANTTMTDIAAAITASLARDGQSPPTDTMPWGNQRLTALASPVDLSDAVNLRTVQTSSHIKASSVSGSNTVTASLVGGSASFSDGQLLLITPTATSTGPVTLSVNGGTAYPVKTPEGSQIAADGFQIGVPYILMLSGGAWVVQSAGNTPAFSQAAISGWDRPASGVYPSITVASTSSVNVPSGTGRIIAPGAQDYTDALPVSWGAQTVTIANLNNAFATTIGVAAGGVIEQVAGIAPASWARTHVVLGVVSHPRTQVVGVQNSPNIYGDSSYTSYDLATLFNNSVRSGLNLIGNVSSPLHFDLTSGSLFLIGGDRNEANDPNFVNFTGIQDVGFYPVVGTGVSSALAQNVPVANYDPSGSGTVTAIPGGVQTSVIHRLYMLGGSYFFLYGQNTYADLVTAVNSVGTDNANTTVPGVLSDATLLGYIIAQKNTTDLKSNTAVLAKAGSLGGAGAGGGSGIPEAPIDGFLYGRQNASWLRSAPLAQGAAGTSRFTSYYTNNLLRWNIGADSSAESGANAGSSFVINRYNDAGTLSGTPLFFSRSNGRGTFEIRPVFGTATPWDSANLTAPAQTGVGQNVSFGTINGTTISGTTVSDGTGNLRTAITAAQNTADSKVSKAGDTMTGKLTVNNEIESDNKVRAASLCVGGDRVTQFAQLEWNVVAAGSGRSEYINNRGGGVGGHYFYGRPFATDATSLLGGFDSSGRFSSFNTSTNPASGGTTTFSFQASGTYGGGYGMVDGSVQGGWWLDNGDVKWGTAFVGQPLAAKMTLTGGGALSTTGGWGPGSDPRLKVVDGPIDDVFGRVMALNTCRGRYVEGYGDGRDKLFVMADDQMAKANPEMLIEDAIEFNGQKYDMYDAGQTIALLTAGLQLALAEIESLKRKLK